MARLTGRRKNFVFQQPVSALAHWLQLGVVSIAAAFTHEPFIGIPNDQPLSSAPFAQELALFVAACRTGQQLQTSFFR
jgi:hypothetical protein